MVLYNANYLTFQIANLTTPRRKKIRSFEAGITLAGTPNPIPHALPFRKHCFLQTTNRWRKDRQRDVEKRGHCQVAKKNDVESNVYKLSAFKLDLD